MATPKWAKAPIGVRRANEVCGEILGMGEVITDQVRILNQNSDFLFGELSEAHDEYTLLGYLGVLKTLQNISKMADKYAEKVKAAHAYAKANPMEVE